MADSMETSLRDEIQSIQQVLSSGSDAAYSLQSKSTEEFNRTTFVKPTPTEARNHAGSGSRKL
ncbi:hypothetical protein EYF80_056572 [Liparis tanakae]|uniref:Uncharacterized protein n=1 Tax=Liparis tanakae TaxID=230148 RepID=A0A4Z2EY56_9TELE|nr:hypothetical protein EYF80_056572 [Liparis tanakae]